MTTILPRALGAFFLAFAIITTGAIPSGVSAATAKTASFDESTLSSEKAKPTLEGEAEGLKSIRVVIENDAGKSVLKKTVKVRDGAWKFRVTKTLKKGTYEVSLRESSSSKAKTLATSTLTIGSQGGTQSNGLISVSSLPLLAGGTAAQGASVPIAYLRVENTSGSAVNLEGFTLKQNGSASAANVIGFATNDDKGGSRTTIGGLETTKQFKNGVAFVPLAAVIESGTVRIFTIKAILSKNAGADLGKQLFIDVEGVKANGSVRTSYPIRGAAWTLIQ